MPWEVAEYNWFGRFCCLSCFLERGWCSACNSLSIEVEISGNIFWAKLKRLLAGLLHFSDFAEHGLEFEYQIFSATSQGIGNWIVWASRRYRYRILDSFEKNEFIVPGAGCGAGPGAGGRAWAWPGAAWGGWGGAAAPWRGAGEFAAAFLLLAARGLLPRLFLLLHVWQSTNQYGLFPVTKQQTRNDS